MDKGFAPIQATSKSKSGLNNNQPLSLEKLQGSLSHYFDDVPDPRVNRTKRHLIKDIIVIALLSTIAGGDGWEDMENYGLSKQQWLKEFLELPNGIPSDDTFRRVFEKLEPEILEQKLTLWIQQLIGPVIQQVIPIDGKTLRGSYDRENGIKNLHLVTVWATENRLVLGQVKVEGHSNKIIAIRCPLRIN
ncbi:ISAs1 family transposase [Laspinema sp. D2d]|uniref:ISAs1 family transposase n=1 Tax=Laspinema sp. D2d TaxID=2953686 RepID=UPI0029500719|nr:ISAs1 family transposase [Laspinema sp. D2d]